MTTRLLIPKLVVFLLACLAVLWWWIPNSDEKGDIPASVTVSTEEISSAPSPAIVQPASEGVYLNQDKTLVSVRFAQMPRLMIIQRIAEVAGFSFSLPSDAIDYWQEALAVDINNEPLQNALNKVIGTKNFNLEIVYDSTLSAHKISALFLGGENSTQKIAASPAALSEPIPFDRSIGEAPTTELAPTNEHQIKRDNFFTADTQDRIALLNEMSPVGEDLNYILTSLRQDAQASVRITAAQRLSFSESYVATQSLLDALSDKDESVVKAAVNSLVALGDASVLPVMATKFANNEQLQTVLADAKSRIAAQYSLGSDPQH